VDERHLKDLLKDVQAGAVSVDAALDKLRVLPYEDLGFARVDHHRALRQGFPEVVYCPGKTPDQVAQIMARLAARNPRVLASRADADTYIAVRAELPGAVYHEHARLIVLNGEPDAEKQPGVVVISAGTSDIPVAEEAALTAELMGNAVERLYDVGVAGIHRLLDHSHEIQSAHVIVVVAGMEGALASVIGGLASAPVIAVPTSVGYGASFGGLAALLTMLNSCAMGVAVVNIDNGFGAGCLAGMINRLAAPLAREQAASFAEKAGQS
jgi:NCAIR mutase (PurE)-related protein